MKTELTSLSLLSSCFLSPTSPTHLPYLYLLLSLSVSLSHYLTISICIYLPSLIPCHVYRLLFLIKTSRVSTFALVTINQLHIIFNALLAATTSTHHYTTQQHCCDIDTILFTCAAERYTGDTRGKVWIR